MKNQELIELAKLAASPCEMHVEDGCVEGNDCAKCGIALEAAERIYNAGYRKQTRAEWECESGHITCSACHSPAPVKSVRTGLGTSVLRAYRTNFCPTCGAAMVGGK